MTQGRRLAVMACAAALAGCQESPERALERRKAEVQVIAEDAVRRLLKDPGSAQFRNQHVSDRGVACGEVNAKNSFGALTGFRRYAVAGGTYAVIEGENMPTSDFADVWAKSCR